jgi:hypothetical protein
LNSPCANRASGVTNSTVNAQPRGLSAHRATLGGPPRPTTPQHHSRISSSTTSVTDMPSSRIHRLKYLLTNLRLSSSLKRSKTRLSKISISNRPRRPGSPNPVETPTRQKIYTRTSKILMPLSTQTLKKRKPKSRSSWKNLSASSGWRGNYCPSRRSSKTFSSRQGRKVARLFSTPRVPSSNIMFNGCSK